MTLLVSSMAPRVRSTSGLPHPLALRSLPAARKAGAQCAGSWASDGNWIDAPEVEEARASDSEAAAGVVVL